MINTFLEIELTTVLVFVYFDKNTYKVVGELKTKNIHKIWSFLKNTEDTLRQYEGEPFFEAPMMEEISTRESMEHFKQGDFLMWELIDIGVFADVFMMLPENVDKILSDYFEIDGVKFKRESENDR